MPENPPSDDEPMSPLARLVTSKNKDDGISYREMERRADRAGYDYSSSSFENVAKDKIRRPLDPDQVVAIAAGIGEMPETIADLDAARWGWGRRAETTSPIEARRRALETDPRVPNEVRAYLLGKLAEKEAQVLHDLDELQELMLGNP